MVKLLSAAQFSFLSLFARYLTLNKIMEYHVLKTADKDGLELTLIITAAFIGTRS